jgi:hypothetical protein
MLTKWNNKKKYCKVNDIMQFLFLYFVCIVTFFFFHDYCMIMLYFDLLLPLFLIISPSFSPMNIYVKLFTFFFYYYYGARLSSNAYIPVFMFTLYTCSY